VGSSGIIETGARSFALLTTLRHVPSPIRFAELTRSGATIVYPPTVQPYGMREFAVRDASGYVLGFGQEHST